MSFYSSVVRADFHLGHNDLTMQCVEKTFRYDWHVIGVEYLKSSLRFELRTKWKLALRFLTIKAFRGSSL